MILCRIPVPLINIVNSLGSKTIFTMVHLISHALHRCENTTRLRGMLVPEKKSPRNSRRTPTAHLGGNAFPPGVFFGDRILKKKNVRRNGRGVHNVLAQCLYISFNVDVFGDVFFIEGPWLCTKAFFSRANPPEHTSSPMRTICLSSPIGFNPPTMLCSFPGDRSRRFFSSSSPSSPTSSKSH